MKIAHKLILGAMVPAALIWGVGFYASSVSEDSLRQAIEQMSSVRAHALMEEIDRAMHTRIADWIAYSGSRLVQDTLRESNRRFACMEDAQQYIDQQDREWRAAPKDRLTPLMERLANAELARDLATKLARLAAENGYAVFGEVFVTNSYGANVAQTNRTSDYRQDDEDWWRIAMRDGLYVGDVAFDESADALSMDICVRIDDEHGVALGVLKATLNVQEVINILKDRSSDRTDSSHHLVLFTADKRIIGDNRLDKRTLPSGARYFDGVRLASYECAFTTERTDQLSGDRLLSTYAISHGYAGFKGLGWTLLLEYRADNVFQPVHTLQQNILLTALGATLVALLLGGTAAFSLSRRINRLARATVAIGSGSLDARIEVGGRDEVAQLGDSFNRMAQDLKRTTRTLREQAREMEAKNSLLEKEVVERMQAEQELRRAHDQTRQLLEAITLVLIGVDADDRITAWNSAAERLFGIETERAVGRRLEELEIGWNHTVLAKDIAQCRAADDPVRVTELGFRRPDGAEGFLDLAVNPMHRGSDKPGSVLLVAADITEQKILQSRLAQSQKLESIGQLAAGIAHEINTPTQYVGDNTRFLQQSISDLMEVVDRYVKLLDPATGPRTWAERSAAIKAELEELDFEFLKQEVPKAVEQSLEGVERVAKIVRSMKEFSHPGGSQMQLADLNRAIESTVTVARNEWKYVAELATDLDPSLPLVPCLVGDFNQVILNMIINAAHAIGDVIDQGRGEKGTITVTTRHEGQWAEVRIADTGSGIPAEIRSKIFDPFFTTKEVGKGTGQGLAIAHTTVVKTHKGQLDVESEPGKGTTFVIRLPIDTPADKDAGAEFREEASCTS